MERLWTKKYVMLIVVSFLLFSSFYLLMPTLPIFVMELGGSESQVGLIVGIFTLSAVILRPIIGGLVDKYGRRVFMLSGLVLFAITMYTYDWITSIFGLIIIRIIHGVSWGVATTATSTAVTDVIPESRRGEGMGWYGLAMTLGMAVGPIAGIWLVESLSFHWLFLICTGLVVGALVSGYSIKLPTVKQQSNQSVSFYEKRVLPIALVMFFLSITYGGIMAFLPLFATSIEVNAGVFFLVYAVTLTIIRPLAGRISDKYGQKKIIVPALAIVSIALVVLTITNGLIGFVISAILYGIGFGSAQPALQAATIQLAPPEKRGVANATFFTAFDLGIGLGSILLGFVSQFMGYQVLFFICAVVAGISFVLFMIFVKEILPKVVASK
ncbi:MFS transporter [Priestia taiwanensis]|uniref:MFS transporter n=1 Tax=Priestia taiwanensis TaxID=1347902 RepID=A0A917AR48_9BACI|nr:MFS transporter [Priestia taiwanensis]MBM7362677.1 MFS family permease [Priestia taiwanensis]GGE64149.1 MFS transporter [Priestia taiwanensis]